MAKAPFPKRTAPGHVKGYEIRGELVEGEVDEQNGIALYYFPNDAILGDAWEAWLTAIEARTGREISVLARQNYAGLCPRHRHLHR